MQELQVLDNKAQANISDITITDIEKIKSTVLDTKDIIYIKWKKYINNKWWRS